MTQSVRTKASALILRSLPIAGASTDTGKRLMAGQVATSFGETFDKGWQFVATPVGNGWASSSYLELAPVVAPPTKKLLYTLAGEDPSLTEAIEKLREKAAHEGIEFDTADFGGVRTEADTTRILGYRTNDYAVYVKNLRARNPNAVPTPIGRWRPIAPFGSSYHNYGCARDLKITKHPESFSEAAAYRRLGELAPSCGLRWGGTFKDKVDPPHMELPITLAEARARWGARL